MAIVLGVLFEEPISELHMNGMFTSGSINVSFLYVYPVKYGKSATTTTNIVLKKRILTLNSTLSNYPYMHN